jgi:hypothetical protein
MLLVLYLADVVVAYVAKNLRSLLEEAKTHCHAGSA